MAQTITFNADNRQKALVEALAKRLGYRNPSDMLRAWLESSIAENISAEEQAQIVALYAPRITAEQAESPPSPQPARRRPRKAA